MVINCYRGSDPDERQRRQREKMIVTAVRYKRFDLAV